jgi:hypothetical protein
MAGAGRGGWAAEATPATAATTVRRARLRWRRVMLMFHEYIPFRDF